MNLPVTGTVTPEVGISKMPMTLNIVCLCSTSMSDTVRSIEQINSNITLICLLLEGVERCSEVLETGFQTELIEVLYPLLVKVDSPNARVNQYALLALCGIARSCGSADLSHLLHQNADYIVDAVSLRLRHVRRHPEAPSVLGVVLRHGSADLLPVFHDVILEVCFYYCFNSVVSFLQDLGCRISQVLGDSWEASYLFQHIAVTTQRFNSVLFRDSSVAHESQDDSDA